MTRSVQACAPLKGDPLRVQIPPLLAGHVADSRSLGFAHAQWMWGCMAGNLVAGHKRAPGKFVMWLRAHRKGLRVGATSVAVAMFVLLVMIWGSNLAESSPPRVAITPTPSATPAVGRPIVEAHPPMILLLVLISAALIAAVVRWQITDSRLEKRRLQAGDLTVVAGVRSAEDMIRRSEATSATGGTPSAIDRYFANQELAVTSNSDLAIESIIEEGRRTSAPVGPLGRWWKVGRDARRSAADIELDVIRLATRAVVAPSTVFTRVSERRVLEDERASVTVARTIEGSESLGGLLLIPVLRVPKGQLLGSLTVTVDDKSARTIPMSAARGTVIRALRSLVLSVAEADGTDLRALLAFTNNATRAILSDSPTDLETRQGWLADLDRQVAVAVDYAERLEWLRSLADIAMTTDVIFAVCPGGCTSTKKVVVAYEEPYGVPVRTAVRRARRFVGIGLADFKIDLHRASEAPTFHLDVRGAVGTYFEQADVVFPSGASDVATPESRPELLHVSPLRGDPHVHLYWREFGGWAAATQNSPAPGTPRLHLRLRERPPGLTGPTFALSLWICLITWTVAYFYPVLFRSSATPNQSAWTTLILAAPALLTGWLLSRLNADTVRVMSLSTFVLILWLSINVASTVTVAALTMSSVQFGALVPFLGITIYHLDWVLLLLSTLAHLVASGILFAGRGLRYARTINERVTE